MSPRYLRLKLAGTCKRCPAESCTDHELCAEHRASEAMRSRTLAKSKRQSRRHGPVKRCGECGRRSRRYRCRSCAHMRKLRECGIREICTVR
jgi:hypothetical protein